VKSTRRSKTQLKISVGTNPIAIAAPAGRWGSFCLDMATSTIPRGRIEVAARRGETLPVGWAIGPDGRPAVTRHRAGDGTAIYLATQPDPKTMARLLEMACASASIQASADAPDGVEAVRRTGGGKSFLFLLNHREAAVDVPISTAGVNLVDGSSVHPGLVHLGSRGVAVIREGW